MASQVRWHGGIRRIQAAGIGIRERQAQEIAGRSPPGYPRLEERVWGKALAPQAKREAIRKMIELFDLSERRACRLVGLSRDSYRHEPEASAQTQALSGRIVEIAHQRRRFGYRRVHDLLRPEFPSVNHKRVYRLYRNANLAVRKRKKAKRPMHERVPLQLATRVNQVWSMDFVSDSLSNGRRLKYLTVADDFSHECVDITVDYGISGQYVTRLLDQAALFRGYPQVVRTDNVLNAIGVAQKEQAHSWLSKQPKKQRYLAALPNGHFHVLRRASIHHNEHKIQQ